MTDLGHTGSTTRGRDLPAVLFIVFVMAGPAILSLTLLAGTSAVVVSWGSTALNSVLLVGLFSSVLFKGLGSRRGLGTVLLVALPGIGAMLVNFAILYLWTGLQTSGGVASHSLCDAFYFSVVTWTTLGYGDFLAAPEARHIVIVEALLGYLMMALLIAAFVSSIAKR
jgi:hypothetical protein